MKTEKITDWISVEKELPKVEMEYLITLETKFLSETCTHICTYVDLAYFSKDLYAVDNLEFQDKKGIAGFYKHTWTGGVREVNPKAWQPLPEKFIVGTKGEITMNENKKEFVEALSNTLKMDSRSGVKSIKYATGIWFEDVRYEEFVKIYFKGGAYKLINVTANSNGANAKEIIKAVYGGDVLGLIFYGFEEEEK